MFTIAQSCRVERPKNILSPFVARFPGTDHHAMDLNFIARDEQLDIQDPLRHYMQGPDDTGETNPGESHELSSELLSVLPRQSHSVQDEILKLSFLNSEDDLQPPVTITLAMDAAPGCGGIAWPAGQVRIKSTSRYQYPNCLMHPGTVQLHRQERTKLRCRKEHPRTRQWDWSRGVGRGEARWQRVDNGPSVRFVSTSSGFAFLLHTVTLVFLSLSSV